MRISLPRTALLASLIVSTFASPSFADIYKFVAPDGTISFSDTPKGRGWKLYLSTARYNFGRSYVAKGGGETYAFDGLIVESASEMSIDPALVRAVIRVESNFDPNAMSPKGARGLMQLIPSTADDMGVQHIFNPRDNIRGGARYLKLMLSQFGDLRMALAAYNAGPETVKQYGGVPPIPETRDYVPTVLHHYRLYKTTWKPKLPASMVTAESR